MKMRTSPSSAPSPDFKNVDSVAGGGIFEKKLFYGLEESDEDQEAEAR